MLFASPTPEANIGLWKAGLLESVTRSREKVALNANDDMLKYVSHPGRHAFARRMSAKLTAFAV